MRYSILAVLDLVARTLVVGALVYASAVALTHWAVRRRRITPFGAVPRFIRRISDPVVLPLEHRVVRSGGNPQDAPLWLVGVVIAGGLLLLTLLHWLHGFVATLGVLAGSGPRVWLGFILSGLISVLMVALLVRVIASWFAISPFRPWMRLVMALTDWIIEPIRKILPPVGMLDFSPLVAWVVLSLLRNFLLSLL